MATTSSAPGDPRPAAGVGPELWVVMPVFNEAPSLRPVVEEWLPVLASCTDDLRLCAIDDGSTDATPVVLQQLTAMYPQVESVTRVNAGHGRTCLDGYQLGLARGARFILQIDSDGQCDAASFPALWSLRSRHPVIFGHRRVRRDGWRRLLVSRALALGAAAATGVRVRDPNVPYRLMSADALRGVIDAVPADVDLVNVYLAALLEARTGIHWVDIVFRERFAGRSHHRGRTMLGRGLTVLQQLRRDRRRLRGPGTGRDGGAGR